ncbi:DUF4390 domain-containing protein [Xylophilus sp. Leaf220]|uniref:DUF4390 domain-containing protein n=1 Tax=Xylophilus sp. Leaf220 TaxID=1735686 RepID=UPI000700D34C|nr:DUF4390 domain-containing protein [Xylophilus sp. Leaf220]KQM72946.1 hypothetical protein ASE76_19395 [Xylophilus sp. Leaf220]
MRLERRLRAFSGALGALGAAARGLAVSCMLACCLLLAGQAPAFAQAHSVEVPQLRLERADDGLYLSATLGFELPPLVEDALYKGIPVFFVAEAEVLRDRWYWSDRRVANAVRYIRLAFQPLTRRWRLNVSPTPIGNAGLGVALSQNFEELPEALASIQRLARWRIADLHDVEADGRYSVEFRFRLDTSQLPRPLQMGVIGRSDWSLSTERSLRLLPDGE